MTALRKPSMDVDAFLDWARDQPGRWELDHGEPVAMAPQTAGHALAKHATVNALARAIARAGLPCHAMPDGMTVRVGARSAYEPDALAYGGERIADDAIEVPNPVIVVEVISPSSAWRDHGRKLPGYFRVASVMHYVIVDPVGRTLVHHRRGEGELIETRVLAEGDLALAPPGLSLRVGEMFGAG